MTPRTRALLLVLATLAAAPAVADDDAAPGASVRFEPAGTSLETALALARERGSAVYLDVASAGCGFCRLLEERVYSRPEVAEALAGFVRLRVEAEAGPGAAAAKRFRVGSFPTLLVLAPDGTEVDRLVGYVGPEAFLREIARIRRGEGTLPALRARLEADPGDVGAALALGAKLAETDPEEALRGLDGLEARVPESDRATRAEVRLTRAIALAASGADEPARGLFERLVREMPDTPAGRRAAPAGILAFLDAPPERALSFLWAARELLPDGDLKAWVDANVEERVLEALESTLRRRAEHVAGDPELLNEVAWTCHERRLLPDEATEWARRAVEASGRKAHVLDTLANLLFRQGEADEAVRLEEEALAKAPDAASRADYEETLVVFRALREHRRARSEGAAGRPR